MINTILITVAVLAAIGLAAAIILYFVSQKFKVVEDPRIGEIESLLPGANCGGCGFPGCRGLAEALTKADDISGMGCPGSSAEVMAQIAKILGKEASAKVPQIAVVRCKGTCQNRQKTLEYDGAKSCAIASANFAGDTGCSFGCLGYGDCVTACRFDAIQIDSATGLPVVDEAKCTSCGACVRACPKQVIEIRNKGPRNMRVWVSCINKDKGAVARKACTAACIGCGKCAKECAFGAITVENNVAYIDFTKCKLCRKCVAACPTKAISEINFPPRKEPAAEVPKPETKPEVKAEAPKEAAQDKTEQIKEQK